MESGFGLTWWVLSLLLVLAVLAVAALAWWRVGTGLSSRDPVLVANTRRLTRLPTYRQALGRQRLRLGVLLGVLAVVLLPLAVAAGRPATGETLDPEKNKRDIMLCLDVSGSMISTDEEILNSFAEIVRGFQGERIGLVLFNNQAVTAFPMTDDYDLVAEQLEGYADGFSLFGSSGEYDPFSGTYNQRILASSLVPDGLASCVGNFDRLDDERPRAVLLGTDNEVQGSGIYTMDQAVEYAQEHDVRVYALNPNPVSRYHPPLAEATEQTGGRAWGLQDANAITDVTAEIERLEAARLPDSNPVYIRTDRPAVPMALAALGLLVYLPLLWWWRR